MPTEKPLTTILSETKQEIVQFVTTRLGILKAEMEEKIARGKKAAPAVGVAVAFLFAGWLVLNFALVGLLHVLFLPSNYAWGFAGLIVAVVDMAIGAVALRSAMRAVKAINLTPDRTLTVLKQDQAWLQNEARTA